LARTATPVQNAATVEGRIAATIAVGTIAVAVAVVVSVAAV